MEKPPPSREIFIYFPINNTILTQTTHITHSFFPVAVGVHVIPRGILLDLSTMLNQMAISKC
jgi:hypothetical protein